MEAMSVDKRIPVCVFAKPPRAGAVKTRLGASVGADVAAALARAFIDDTLAAVSRLPWVRPILATTEPCADELQCGAEVWMQGRGNLGARLERVVRHALCDAPFAIALGADTPGLPRHLLESARTSLGVTDAVLGPSDDGGFYLLGLSRCPRGLLANLPWSAPDTFAETRARLLARHFTPRILTPWFDVDRPQDLARLERGIANGGIAAPETARILSRLGALRLRVPECASV
jgi:rSAM/selenodomain-associated transferase 1